MVLAGKNKYLQLVSRKKAYRSAVIRQKKYAIRYREIGYCLESNAINDTLPNINEDIIKDEPVFGVSINNLKHLNKVNYAIEGSPCLFGKDTIYLKLRTTNNIEQKFDMFFSDKNLYEFVKKNNIKQAELIYENISLDQGQYKLLERIIFIASRLSLPCIIGCPDIGYRDYFEKLCTLIPNSGYLQQEYYSILDKFTELFNIKINELKDKHSNIHITFFNFKQTELVDKFKQYQAKLKDNFKRNIENPLKKIAYFNFTLLPALPFILYGKKNIIEINTIMELENIKYVKKLFPEIKISAITFPLIGNKQNDNASLFSNKEDKLFDDQL